ncbi:MAG TPA: hypothetical protein P5150_05850 [Candidatus Ratteibacteria bacterium]|nr:hypothetical protein [Candidatus Ratteibacteria bacterium]
MKKLFVDYDKLLVCKCQLKCSYILHPENNGIINLKEQIAFLLACRKCEDYPCVNACPNQALKRENGVVKRSNILCVSCKSCLIACPFGTIVPDIVSYLTSKCDFCINRLKENEIPVCVESCNCGAFKFVDEKDIEKTKITFEVGKILIVNVYNYLSLQGIEK